MYHLSPKQKELFWDIREKMERKRLALKEIKNFLSTLRPIPIEEQLENYKCVYASENEEQEQQNPKIVKVLRTKMGKK